MSKTFQVHILASDRYFYEGECESLIIPALDGQYGILADHADMIFALIPGEMTFKVPEKDAETLFVSGGMVKVEKNDVIVLTDTVERAEEIDENRARRDLAEAQEAVLQKKSIAEYRIAEANLARAIGRLRIKK